MFRFDVEKYRHEAIKHKIIDNYENNNINLLKGVSSSSANKSNLDLLMSNLELAVVDSSILLHCVPA